MVDVQSESKDQPPPNEGVLVTSGGGHDSDTKGTMEKETMKTDSQSNADMRMA
jgi:hypothetical protein